MANFEGLTEAQLEELMLTAEDLRELEQARKMPIVFDEDSPETTPERALKFQRVNPRRERRKCAF